VHVDGIFFGEQFSDHVRAAAAELTVDGDVIFIVIVVKLGELLLNGLLKFLLDLVLGFFLSRLHHVAHYR
jgi:hypothetical protein